MTTAYVLVALVLAPVAYVMVRPFLRPVPVVSQRVSGAWDDRFGPDRAGGQR